MENKRIRSQNFTNQEKNILLNIIYKYKDVENKKTDGVTSIEKKKIWDTIATEFNAACPDGNLREATVLRKFYENKKKEVRKVVADEKTEINGTGGGPAPIIKKDDTFDLILSIVNHKTAFGLENKYSNLTDPLPTSSRVNMEEFTYVFSTIVLLLR
ncbi:hypothetical protein JTB14_003461 [Gonioctena quinquepunctata]|nr:hypothetical protein JTB14_003461 [Gonioctena quinquepunctata]